MSYGYSEAVKAAAFGDDNSERLDGFERLVGHIEAYWREYKTDAKRRWIALNIVMHELNRSGLTSRQVKKRVAVFGKIDR